MPPSCDSRCRCAGVAVTNPGLGRPGQGGDSVADESRTYQLLRPPDLVVLSITAVGLTERQGAGGPELISNGAQSRLIVEFAAQHIAETVPPAGSSSSQARLAGPSRLQFHVDNQPIPLSASGILSAMSRLRPIPGTQSNASTLEIPWRVLLGLGQGTTCVHS